MNRTIPGTVDIEGVEYLYVQVVDNEGFRLFVDEAMKSCEDVPLPQSGGVIEEKARIALEDDSSLLAVSYRGDISGWRRKLTAFCESTGRKWGVASNHRITLSDGTEIDLSSSEVTFEK